MEAQTKQRATRKGNAKQSSKVKRPTSQKERNSVPQIQMLEIDSIFPDPTQPRKTFDAQSLDHLAQSIAEHGVLQPITVRKSDDGYIIVMGERRFRASKLAGLTTIPAMVRDYRDTEILEVQIIENLQRKDVEPTEEAEAIQFLLERYESGEIAKRLGRSENYIRQRIKLAGLIEGFKVFAVRVGHSLASLYEFVDKHKDTLIEETRVQEPDFNVYGFLHILSEYVDGGLYSFLFHVAKDQTYKIEDKRLIVFELDEVRDNKEILSVMLKLIKSAIQRTIWRNRSERGIILFDEFAKQLKFPNVLESVEFYYQAIRKQNGAIGIILQSINQLPENATSASILENTQVVYSLRNEKGYDDLARRLNLSNHDLNQLKSLRNNLTGERKYTEIFIKIGKESNVFRLEVPPEVYAAYLTDGVEHGQIMELFAQFGDMERAITEFINQQKKMI